MGQPIAGSNPALSATFPAPPASLWRAWSGGTVGRAEARAKERKAGRGGRSEGCSLLDMQEDRERRILTQTRRRVDRRTSLRRLRSARDDSGTAVRTRHRSRIGLRPARRIPHHRVHVRRDHRGRRPRRRHRRTPRRADVGIAGGDITAIDDLAAAEAERRIDATGLTVAPGFIDTHTHTEGVLLGDPQHAMGLCQGITTEIFGLDGLSYAPLSQRELPAEPALSRGPARLAARGPRHVHRRRLPAGVPPDVAINTAYLAAHGAIRLEALGFRDAPLVGDPLDHASRLVRESIEQGAVGISSGLNYYPSRGATRRRSSSSRGDPRRGRHPRDRAADREPGAGVRGWRARRGDGGRPRSGARSTSPTTGPSLGRPAGPWRCSPTRRPRRPTASTSPSTSTPTRAARRTRSATCRPGRTRAAPTRSSSAWPTRPTAPGSSSTWTTHHDARAWNPLPRSSSRMSPATPTLEGARLADIAADRGVTAGAALADLLSRTNSSSLRIAIPQSTATGARSGATRCGCSLATTTWSARTSRRSGASATRARSAPIRASSAACDATSAGSPSRRWSLG